MWTKKVLGITLPGLVALNLSVTRVLSVAVVGLGVVLTLVLADEVNLACVVVGSVFLTNVLVGVEETVFIVVCVRVVEAATPVVLGESSVVIVFGLLSPPVVVVGVSEGVEIVVGL